MHWILQDNMFNEKEWTTLVHTLERFSLPYSIHKVVPFVGDLIPEPVIVSDKVICMGSYSMRHSAKVHDWTPGVYDLFEQNFIVQRNHWGKHLLNHDSWVLPFGETTLTEPMFIRPIDDSKYFAGKIFDPEDFNNWRAGICICGYDYGNSLTKDTLIQICKPKEIWAEYRYWIVDGRIVTKSRYKLGHRVTYSSEVDQRFDFFVASVTGDPAFCLGAWQPHRAFVIDVCETPDGIKIVEINTLNSAGFYAGNVTDIVLTLERMEG